MRVIRIVQRGKEKDKSQIYQSKKQSNQRNLSKASRRVVLSSGGSSRKAQELAKELYLDS